MCRGISLHHQDSALKCDFSSTSTSLTLIRLKLSPARQKQPIADLCGDSVGDVRLHGGHVLLGVIDRDEQVTRVCDGEWVPPIFQVVVQLQPVEERGRGGGA